MFGKIVNGKFVAPPTHCGNRLNVYKDMQWLAENGYHELTKDEIAKFLSNRKPSEIKFSKLAIIRALGDAWPTWKAKIAEAGMTEYWDNCTYLSTADDDFNKFYRKLSGDEKRMLITNCKY